MRVKLLAHTKLSEEFARHIDGNDPFVCPYDMFNHERGTTDSEMIALTAIRTCYSANKPCDIVRTEGQKYFGRKATDGEGGNESDRLFRHITRSGHSSTLEHLTYTFAIEGVSRSLLAQLTRHRTFSFSVQSQRYVKFGSGDKSGGFDYVWPRSVAEQPQEVWDVYSGAMDYAQATYDSLRAAGVPAEDARFVLPNAAACNLVMTANLRAVLDFYGKRKRGNGAQWEIADLSERLREEITKVDPWTAPFFDEV